MNGAVGLFQINSGIFYSQLDDRLYTQQPIVCGNDKMDNNDMPKEFSRARRVGELIQRELALIIQREINDPQWGMLTISSVKLSPDLKLANIYTSVLNSLCSPDKAIEHLNQQAPLLRHHLSQRLTVRSTPRLVFEYDDTVNYTLHLSQLLDSVTKPRNDETS